MTVFGVFSSLSGPVLTVGDLSNLVTIIYRIPFWTWIRTLFINVGNQRQPDAAKEDRLNKTWRPFPSKRLTPAQAKLLMLALHPTVSVISLYLSGLPQCVSLMTLGYLYNDLGGADISCLIRNALNGIALPCFSSGTTMVVLASSEVPLNDATHHWFVFIDLVYFSTVQIQDMEDQAGDKQR